ncbi:GNAT family N-acetyltransferase [Planctomycetota bacterium]|nr:GNAT family N-acetyltransferase [Planctomycetota bacterium]
MGTQGSYDSGYEQEVKLRGGEALVLRVIRPGDEAGMVKFHEGLSPLTVRRRYFDSMSLAARTKHERLVRICKPELERECAIVAMVDGEIVAVGRLEDHAESGMAEFAVLIVDAWQGKGLGRVVIEELVKMGEKRGLKGIEAEMLLGNTKMRKLLKSMGFEVRDDFEMNAMFGVKRFDG